MGPGTGSVCLGDLGALCGMRLAGREGPSVPCPLSPVLFKQVTCLTISLLQPCRVGQEGVIPSILEMRFREACAQGRAASQGWSAPRSFWLLSLGWRIRL